MRKIVYLGGPINGCTDEEAKGWRASVAPLLAAKGYLVSDPMVRDYRGKEDEAVSEIVENDKKDIQQADIMLMSCPKPSVGTSMEIFYGYALNANKRRICVLPEGAAVSPWLRYHATDIFIGTEAEAVEELL